VTALADLLIDGGFQTVYYHILKGPQELQVQTNWWPAVVVDPKMQPNTIPGIIQAVQARGINVVGWGMCFGKFPVEEGSMAASMVQKYNLAGWVIDVEGMETEPNAPGLVNTIVTKYRDACDKPIGYCSWPFFTNAHLVPVAQMGMSLCDVGIPMAYVMEKDLKESPNSTTKLVDKSMAEWRQFTDKPLIMAGRAFKENGYTTNTDAILTFDVHVRTLGAAGTAWWFLDHAQPSKHPDWWMALKLTAAFVPAIA